MLSVRSLLVLIVAQSGVIAFLLLRPAPAAPAAITTASAASANVRGSEAPASDANGREAKHSRRAYLAKQKQQEERNLYFGRVEEPGAAKFRLLGLGNGVPTDALVFAGVTAKDRPAVEAAARKLWNTMDQALAARAVQDPEAAAQGKVAFTIPADAAGGNAVIASFRDEMTAQFGAEPAEKLLKGLHHGAYFGSFGRANVRIELSEGPGAGTGTQTMINYQMSDPETGENVGMSGGPFNDRFFSQSMGKATYEKVLAAKAQVAGAK